MPPTFMSGEPKIIHSGRQTKLLLPRKAPEAKLLLGLYERIKHLHQHFKDRILIS